MDSFTIPIHLEDLEQAGSDDDARFRVQSVANVAKMSSAQQDSALDTLTEAVSQSPLRVAEQEIFDMLYSFASRSTQIPAAVSERVFDVLCHVLTELKASEPQLLRDDKEGGAAPTRAALKMAALLLAEMAMVAEQKVIEADRTTAGSKRAGGHRDADGESDWDGMRLKVIEAMDAGLAMDLPRLWKAKPDEAFVTLFTRTMCKICENPAAMRARAVQEGALRVLARCAAVLPSISSALEAQLMQLLTGCQHFAPALAELGALMCSDAFGNNEQVVRELFNDVRQMPADVSGLKHVAKFVEEFACLRPALVLQALPTALMAHLDADNYSMRSSICTAISHIVLHLFEEAAAAEAEAGGDGGELLDEQRRRDAQTREDLLDMLLHRLRDSSSWTRAAVLKAWVALVARGCVPKKQLPELTRLCLERLQDKTASVRKQAIIMFRALLEHNPYTAAELNPACWREAAQELMQWFEQNPLPILAHVTSAFAQGKGKAADGGDAEGDAEGDDAEGAEEADAEAQLAQFAELNAQHKQKQVQFEYVRAGLAFAELLAGEVVPLLLTFIGAKSVTDVQETLRFFVVARDFNLPGVGRAVRKMLGCVWSHEATGAIRSELIESLQRLYVLAPAEQEGEGVRRKKLSPRRIAANFVELARGCTLGEMASLGQAIKLLMEQRKLGGPVIEALWDIAERARDLKAGAAPAPDAVRADNRVALHVLVMAAGANRNVIGTESRLATLVEIGFGDLTRREADYAMARNSCLALKLLPSLAGSDDSRREYIEFALGHLHTMLASGAEWGDGASARPQEWFSAAQHAVDTIFLHDAQPERAMEVTLRAMGAAAAGAPGGATTPAQLARLFFVLGHVALKILVRTEEAAARLKKQRAEHRKKKEAGKDAVDDELDTAAEEEAADEDLVLAMSERDIVCDNLLGAFGPAIEQVVANKDGQFADPLLRQSATMALSKFMGISSVFCERNLQLLFTVLLNAPEPNLRANTIVALGDLAFRFPNSVEPWTDRLYAPLRDADLGVRKNALQVLSHLILNDMVKVRGKISELCLCLTDSDARIRGLANLFFDELSKRHSNPVYSLLPDILSSLSKASGVSREQFQDIMQFLTGPKFVQKEKQTLSLVEKLCQRFPATYSTDAEWKEARDIAFCLQNLSFSDKAFSKLVSMLKSYKPALGDAAVYGAVTAIAKKVMAKGAKAGDKSDEA
eukprot:g6871.t1